MITRGPRIPLSQLDPIEQSKQRRRHIRATLKASFHPSTTALKPVPCPKPSLEKLAWSGSSLYYLDLVSGSQDSLIYCQENDLTLRTR